MNLLKYLLFLLLQVLISACIQLPGAPPPKQFFVLESITNDTDFLSAKKLRVVLELTDFPEHLKRYQIVAQQQANIIHLSDAKRWATPLEDQLLTLLADNLQVLLPEATIVISPWQSDRHADHSLQIAVNKLSGILGQKTDVDIRWQLTSKTGGNSRGYYIDQQPIDKSYEGLVKALNRGLDGLSRELARALAESEGQ